MSHQVVSYHNIVRDWCIWTFLCVCERDPPTHWDAWWSYKPVEWKDLYVTYLCAKFRFHKIILALWSIALKYSPRCIIFIRFQSNGAEKLHKCQILTCNYSKRVSVYVCVWKYWIGSKRAPYLKKRVAEKGAFLKWRGLGESPLNWVACDYSDGRSTMEKCNWSAEVLRNY